MHLQQFIQKYQGTRLDLDAFPKGAQYQCWDLAQAWFNILGLDYWLRCKWSGGVKDIWEHRLELFDENEWEFEQNERLTVPRPGDIVVWNGSVGGGYGHIGIVVSATVNTLDVFEQNNGQGDGDGLNGDQCKTTRYFDWRGIYGFIRPKTVTPKPPTPPMPPKPLPTVVPNRGVQPTWIGNKHYEGLVSDNNAHLAVSEIIDRDKEITALKKERDVLWQEGQQWVQKISVLEAQKSAVEQEKSILATELTKAREQLAKEPTPVVESPLESPIVEVPEIGKQPVINMPKVDTIVIEKEGASNSSSKPFWQSKKFWSLPLSAAIGILGSYLSPENTEIILRTVAQVEMLYLGSQTLIDTNIVDIFQKQIKIIPK